MEKWDILNINREPTGRIAIRGKGLDDGDYHLVVLMIITNSNKEILITKRSAIKNEPCLWEIPGGAVTAGETSQEAAIREVGEEVGISLKLKENKGKIIGQKTYQSPHGWMVDIWHFEKDVDLNDLILQEEEVSDARWVTREKVIELIEKGQFFKGQVFIDEVFNKGIL